MLRFGNLLVVVSLGLVPLGCGPVGCSGEDPEQDKAAKDQFAGAIEQKLPEVIPGTQSIYGTWGGDSVAGHFNPLVLMSDGRYHYSKVIACATTPCNPVVADGTYKLYAREGRTYVALSARAPEPERYEYTVGRGSLRLRPLVPGSDWYAMTSAEKSWCGAEADCNVQALPPAECKGSYKCENNACSGKCTVAPTDTVNNAAQPGPTEVCPTAAECSIANSSCTSNPRDQAACAKVEGCRRCFPHGWDLKGAPETQDPNANPVLKK